jgi:hypothetical protein
MATATAIVVCTALKIAREEMIRVMHQEHAHPGRSGRSAFQL